MGTNDELKVNGPPSEAKAQTVAKKKVDENEAIYVDSLTARRYQKDADDVFIEVERDDVKDKEGMTYIKIQRDDGGSADQKRMPCIRVAAACWELPARATDREGMPYIDVKDTPYQIYRNTGRIYRKKPDGFYVEESNVLPGRFYVEETMRYSAKGSFGGDSLKGRECREETARGSVSPRGGRYTWVADENSERPVRTPRGRRETCGH